jgi:hypothetical protein
MARDPKPSELAMARLNLQEIEEEGRTSGSFNIFG